MNDFQVFVTISCFIYLVILCQCHVSEPSKEPFLFKTHFPPQVYAIINHKRNYRMVEVGRDSGGPSILFLLSPFRPLTFSSFQALLFHCNFQQYKRSISCINRSIKPRPHSSSPNPVQIYHQTLGDQHASWHRRIRSLQQTLTFASASCSSSFWPSVIDSMGSSMEKDETKIWYEGQTFKGRTVMWGC